MAEFVEKQYTAGVLQTLYQFSLDRKLTDFTIRAGGKTAYCHQAVISAKSEYFESLCTSGIKEAVLKSTSEEDGQILDAIVKYMYLGKTEITEETVSPLLTASNFIKHRDLNEACERFMMSSVNVENLDTYVKLAKRMKLDEARKKCMDVAKKKFSELLQTNWILSLSASEVYEYLKDDELEVTREEDVIWALQKWLQQSTSISKTKKDYLERLFSCVRLRACSKETLQALSIDDNIWINLRTKLLEYLQHGKHGEETQPRRLQRKPVQIQPARPQRELFQEKVVIVGGQSTGGVKHDSIFSGDVVSKAPVCKDAKWFSVCAVKDSLIVSGGCNEVTQESVSEVQMFSFVDKTWQDLPSMPSKRHGHGSACLGHKLFIMTGKYKDANYKNSHSRYDVYILDLQKRSWSKGPEMLVSVFRPGIAVINPDILVIGGNTGRAWSAQTCKYNLTRNQWIICASMPQVLENFIYSTAVVDARVFILAHDAFLMYENSTDQWSRLQSPVKPSRSCALVYKAGQLIALGGYDEDYKEPHGHLQSFDLLSKTWSLDDSSLPIKLCGHAAVVLKVPTTNF